MLYLKKGKKCRTLCKFDLMYTPGLLGLVKMSDIETVQKVYLIELSELIVFSYDQCNIKDGLRCWRNGIYILWLISSLLRHKDGQDERGNVLLEDSFMP